jgi:HSP20 family protein
MKLIVPVFLASFCTLPGFGWILGHRLFGPSHLEETLMSPSQILRRQQELMRRSRSYTSPPYEFHNNEKEIKISIDVSGVSANDINVSVQDQVLFVSGQRKLEKEGYKYISEFSQSFPLDLSVEIDKLSASLDNGVLVVTAPKDVNRLEQTIRKIPVMQSADDRHPDTKMHAEIVDDINEIATVDI